jgi:uncharacterized protein (TIGR02466 family)
MSAPEIFPMFAVPFALGRHPDPNRLNPALKKAIFAIEARGDVARNPEPRTQRTASLYESHFHLFRDPDPAIQELKTFCWDQLLAVVGRLNAYDLPTLEQLDLYNHAWFHVTRRGGYFGLHNHPNASWSGVYCVDPGQHDPDRRDSGQLTFVNPMTAFAMHMDPAIENIPPPYGVQMRSFRLEPGQLVIFPSWVLHDVKPFEGEGERITIAFNAWFQLPHPAAKG